MDDVLVSEACEVLNTLTDESVKNIIRKLIDAYQDAKAWYGDVFFNVNYMVENCEWLNEMFNVEDIERDDKFNAYKRAISKSLGLICKKYDLPINAASSTGVRYNEYNYFALEYARNELISIFSFFNSPVPEVFITYRRMSNV